jgi:Cu+-exporting ATPase
MSAIKAASEKPNNSASGRNRCYHCGEACLGDGLMRNEKAFCCEGCLLVFDLIQHKGLCNYYELQNHPGLSQIRPVRKEKFAVLDQSEVAASLFQFHDGKQVVVRFFIPGVHCSSCMWLLEHLNRIHSGVIESRLNFSSREATIRFRTEEISLRQVAELLATIGYEPEISLQGGRDGITSSAARQRMYRLGVAGFCFSFIMMMSFPEYFGGAHIEHRYVQLLRLLNLILALPVFFFSAGEFFSAAFKGLRTKTLNIDAPVALAILITFLRSVYEISTGSGAGYLDSMSGIVFFMLIGRMVQERSYRFLSFHRDYRAYFPIAVSVESENGMVARKLEELRAGDIVLLNPEEIIPADGTLIEGNGEIDYSFVSGEIAPVAVKKGERVFAGGKQIGTPIRIRLQKAVAGSYLTSLWNNQAFAGNKNKQQEESSRVHLLSRYFTITLFSLALLTAIFWGFRDPSRILNAVSSMLIVACPCALLLATTFTNGSLLRLFSESGLFIRNASVLEQLARVDFLVFDKTGTLTTKPSVEPLGPALTDPKLLRVLHTAASASRHPLSRALADWSAAAGKGKLHFWKDVTGKGLMAQVDSVEIKIGSPSFLNSEINNADVVVQIENEQWHFRIQPGFRKGLDSWVQKLQQRFQTAVLSGDRPVQKTTLQKIFGSNTGLHFEQKPEDKLRFIQDLQHQGHRVLMLGDGLNDAGALRQSEVGISLTEHINNFTPACDAILDAKQFSKLPALLAFARTGQRVIAMSFVISILYNIVGLSIAMQGLMNPMIAAILMPTSTLSIVLISTGLTQVRARMMGLV